MGNSLQEQLLKAGLVSAHQARQNRTEKRKQDRQPSRGEADADRLAARKAQAEKAERDRMLEVDEAVLAADPPTSAMAGAPLHRGDDTDTAAAPRQEPRP